MQNKTIDLLKKYIQEHPQEVKNFFEGNEEFGGPTIEEYLNSIGCICNRDSFAVEFAEWIDYNLYERTILGDWAKTKNLDPYKMYTTAELLEIFKQQRR